VVLAPLSVARPSATLELEVQMPVRVLIVDDQEPFRLAARMVVELTDGFEVVGEAETGEDGVAMTTDLAPDLVLMDVNLPGIDGLDACRGMRSGRVHPQGGVRSGPPGGGLGSRHPRLIRVPASRQ
jgi:CheY-like chemotaxis protein